MASMIMRSSSVTRTLAARALNAPFFLILFFFITFFTSTPSPSFSFPRKSSEKCIKKSDAGDSVVEKFKPVSGAVWICLKGMIVEKTIKEESSQNNHYNDNYNYNSDPLFFFGITI